MKYKLSTLLLFIIAFFFHLDAFGVNQNKNLINSTTEETELNTIQRTHLKIENFLTGIKAKLIQKKIQKEKKRKDKERRQNHYGYKAMWWSLSGFLTAALFVGLPLAITGFVLSVIGLKKDPEANSAILSLVLSSIVILAFVTVVLLL